MFFHQRDPRGETDPLVSELGFETTCQEDGEDHTIGERSTGRVSLTEGGTPYPGAAKGSSWGAGFRKFDGNGGVETCLHGPEGERRRKRSTSCS